MGKSELWLRWGRRNQSKMVGQRMCVWVGGYKGPIAGAVPCAGPNPTYTAPAVGGGLCGFARDVDAHCVLRASSRR